MLFTEILVELSVLVYFHYQTFIQQYKGLDNPNKKDSFQITNTLITHRIPNIQGE